MTKQQAPAVRPAPKPRAKAPSSRGQYIDFRPRRRQVVKKTAVKRELKLTVKETPPAPAAPKKEMDKPASKPVSKLVSTPVNTVPPTVNIKRATKSTIETITPAAEETKPTSPFIASVNVDKRPLSSRRIVADDTEDSSVPTVIREEDFYGEIEGPYATRRSIKQQDPHKKLKGEKGSNKSKKKEKGERKPLPIGFIVAIVLTIILGAAVGAFVYLAFFQ